MRVRAPTISLRRLWNAGALLALLLGASAGAVTLTQAPQVNVGGRQVTLWWKTDVSSSTEVAWGPTSASSFAGYPNQSSFSGLAGTSHSRTLRRLPPGAYFYRVKSTDGAAPVESAEGAFVVPRNEGFPLGDLAFNGTVLAVTRLGDTWYVGGSFTGVGATTGSGASVDPATGAFIDVEFPEVSGTVSAVAPDGAGGLFLGGTFKAVGGLARNNAAHLLPDRGVDPDWRPDLNGGVNALAVSGSAVYLVGNFTTVGGNARNRAAAVDASTGALRAWNPDLNSQVSVVTASGSTVYLSGLFSTVGGVARPQVAAVDATTGALSPWIPSVTGQILAIAVSGTTVYLGGNFVTAQRNYAARSMPPPAPCGPGTPSSVAGSAPWCCRGASSTSLAASAWSTGRFAAAPRPSRPPPQSSRPGTPTSTTGREPSRSQAARCTWQAASPR